ncbi:DNA-directed RNA polymerase subunit beta [Tasmannia lanceolata]|uniref:DNA-directed RNA polymerase subunit beta n=1 Tax=Tasmannia lanceolata TaxID=3420 RepID=UPI0040632C2E
MISLCLPPTPLLPKTLISRHCSLSLSPLNSHLPKQLSYPPLSLSSFRFHSSCSSLDTSIPVIEFEEIVEQDWSFIDPNNENTKQEIDHKTNLITSAGGIGPNSRVLVSLGTEDFVDQLVSSSSFKLLLVVHYSLFLLAGIKEKYDSVKCWQGELVEVPEKWAPFDTVFLCYLPALNFSLDQIFGTLAGCCSPGARVVISYSQGREIVEQQRQQHPDLVTSDLPDKFTLEKVAADHSFQITKFVDEPTFYLAVLKFRRDENNTV